MFSVSYGDGGGSGAGGWRRKVREEQLRASRVKTGKLKGE